MINKGSLDISWINEVSSSNSNADKILVEKVIRSLLLIEGLTRQNLDFVFKGGTALMLLMNSTKRLSIDVDIILPVMPGNFDEILNKVVLDQSFTRFEQQKRKTNSKIKKAHYQFYYEAVFKTKSPEEKVLLDILFEEINYQEIIKLPIESSFLKAEGKPSLAKCPSGEDFLGDKLTAFAPNTTGIPYFKKDDSMSMEIIKQLYDIGNLVDIAGNLDTIKNTFKLFAKTELEYRDRNDLTYEDVLEDIYQTALCIISRGVTGNGEFDQLLAGIQRVASFIFSESFHLEKAITFASKAAYVSALIKHDAVKIEKYNNPDQLKDWVIVEPFWPKLNKLKKSNPEAFFYWYKIFELGK